jgi:cytochrome P450
MLLNARLEQQDCQCPFLRRQKVSRTDIVSHSLLFTSSITAKALASLLTAIVLNLFLYPGGMPLVSRIRAEGAVSGDVLLKSILLETERLSPPIVGVMRRAERDVILRSSEGQPATLVPSGWDVWLYFVGAGRDPTVYEQADAFLPERFISASEQTASFAFGAGPKSCLGRHVVRQIVLTVSRTLLNSDILLDGSVQARGVKGWLGWDTGLTAEAFARDLKQLPCQRPRDVINVSVHRGAN